MKKIGVYGTGAFAVAIANILKKNNYDILIFSHREELTSQINNTHKSSNAEFNEGIWATSNVENFIKECKYIFIIVPSLFFEEAIKKISPHVNETHVIVHGTKGFFVDWKESNTLEKKDIITLSSLLYKNLKTKSIAYLSGPNIAKELHENKSTATLVSSLEIKTANEIAKLLETDTFSTYTTTNINGAELCGILKNIYAVAIGYAENLGMNAKGTLITRALTEIEKIFELFNYPKDVIKSVAGIGDLIATAFSKDSRNHSLGVKISQGISIKEIFGEKKTYEGLNSIKAVKFLSNNYSLELPIVNFLYEIIFHQNLKNQKLI